MFNQATHRYQLEVYSGPNSRHRCPQCKRIKRFTYYLEANSGEIVAHNVGRCNRENACGYHYTPRQYYADNNWKQPPSLINRAERLPTSNPLQYISHELMQQTLRAYEANNFVLYLRDLFGPMLVEEICRKYLIGTSKYWKGATCFWQVDAQQRVRQCKAMLYDPNSGKRVKANQEAFRFNEYSGIYELDKSEQDKVRFIGKQILRDSGANLKQCFFGEHLLTSLESGSTVGIVESEKTATIASVYYPTITWIATGGKNGCKWTDPNVFASLDRFNVMLFPDGGAYKQWDEYAKRLREARSCAIHVSNLIENRILPGHVELGADIVDLIVRRDTSGIALHADFDYSICWDR